MKSFLIFISLFLRAVQNLPDCSFDVCANGGMWSEWSTTSKCPTECGSCSKNLYTRKCMSTNFPNCPCVGDTYRYILCNSKTCVYPAQRTCCIPYVPMIINGSQQCGPVPKDPDRSSESPCCPKGGFWSTWSAYFKDGEKKAWSRTRRCLTEEAGCPCTDPGTTIETSTACPCRKLVDVSSLVKTNLGTYTLNPVYNDEDCTASQVMESQKSAVGEPCNEYTSWKYYRWTNAVRYVKPGRSDYVGIKISNCEAAHEKKIFLYCDRETLN